MGAELLTRPGNRADDEVRVGMHAKTRESPLTQTSDTRSSLDAEQRPPQSRKGRLHTTVRSVLSRVHSSFVNIQSMGFEVTGQFSGLPGF